MADRPLPRPDALLLSPRGDAPELQEQSARVDARLPDNPVTPWVRDRLLRSAR